MQNNHEAAATREDRYSPRNKQPKAHQGVLPELIFQKERGFREREYTFYFLYSDLLYPCLHNTPHPSPLHL